MGKKPSNPLRRLKINPFQLPQYAQRRVDAGKMEAPIWSKVMGSVPMAPITLRTCIPTDIGAFVLPGTADVVWKRQIQLSHNHARTNQNNLMQQYHITVPNKIVYDEDLIRMTFYRDHPFELDRARVLFSNDSKLDTKWVDIYGGESKIQLSGERTLYLESTGKARKEAYRTALSEFYDARKSEERITAKNKNEPQKDFFSDKPFAAAFNINELSAVETTLVISDEVAMVKTGINRK